MCTPHIPEESLIQSLQGRVVVVGIGNPQRGDDRAGIRVAHLLHRLLFPSSPNKTVTMQSSDILPPPPPGRGGRIVASIDVGTTPESYTDRIARLHPETILLVDAVDFGEPPGFSLLLTEAELTVRPYVSSHRTPLLLLMRYLAERTDARPLLLGIQAGDIDWFVPMTPAVRRETARLVRLLRRWQPADTQPDSEVGRCTN